MPPAWHRTWGIVIYARIRIWRHLGRPNDRIGKERPVHSGVPMWMLRLLGLSSASDGNFMIRIGACIVCAFLCSGPALGVTASANDGAFGQAGTAGSAPQQVVGAVKLGTASDQYVRTDDGRSSSSEPQDSPDTSAAAQLAAQRLRDNLTTEMLDNFGLFIYVSKAAAGPWAQHMYVFQKEPANELYLLYDWPVSTGRESLEVDAAGQQVPTSTPAGYYEFDPGRFFTNYHSIQWDEPMPYAMFFRWADHGVQTGLAIHAAADDAVGQLGNRASAGCIRLAPENARILFNLVHDSYKGMAPQFAVDSATGTVMNNGMLEHDVRGNLKFNKGYRALVFVDEYGGKDLEASLY